MSVTDLIKTDNPEIRQSLAIVVRQKSGKPQPMPKKGKVARLKIINGRPYYYAIKNIWDRKAQRCRQKSKYLGKVLPRGYRLVK